MNLSCTFGNQTFELLCQAVCTCDIAGKMCLASGQTELEKIRQETSACEYFVCSSLGMWGTSDSFRKLLLPLVASYAFTIACGWSFPPSAQQVRILDKQSSQEFLTGLKNVIF